MAMDNAAARESFASEVYSYGVDYAKKTVLDRLPPELANLHIKGGIHIHDMESFGKIYNCSTPDWHQYLRGFDFSALSAYGKMAETFEAIKFQVTRLAAAQSGGIGFGNLDIDLEKRFDELGLEQTERNSDFLNEIVASFIQWVNRVRTRFCRETYYLTVNLGLATGFWGRAVTKAFLRGFEDSPNNYTKPNIVFKVSGKVNSSPGSANYDLYQMALHCTVKRMIPTYLLMDSSTNSACMPESLNVMGCRTRVYDNVNGACGTIKRGNLAYTSVNLPRAALSAGNLPDFFKNLRAFMDAACAVMEIRNKMLAATDGKYVEFVLREGLWQNVSSIEDMLRQGSRSIGFIGLSETVEILSGEKMYLSEAGRNLAWEIVRFMREYVDEKRNQTGDNYSLLATPGEMLSGRFCALDSAQYPHPAQEKGFYTNSFHVDVDAGISPFEKIRFEGPFHRLCNGGSICYVEFASAPLENTVALSDALSYAERHGVSYMGFNFPMDICKDCGQDGTFDDCPECGSKNILRIRRVSGYLEDSTYFTDGKKAEIRRRRPNMSF